MCLLVQSSRQSQNRLMGAKKACTVFRYTCHTFSQRCVPSGLAPWELALSAFHFFMNLTCLRVAQHAYSCMCLDCLLDEVSHPYQCLPMQHSGGQMQHFSLSTTNCSMGCKRICGECSRHNAGNRLFNCHNSVCPHFVQSVGNAIISNGILPWCALCQAAAPTPKQSKIYCFDVKHSRLSQLLLQMVC